MWYLSSARLDAMHALSNLVFVEFLLFIFVAKPRPEEVK